MQKPTLSETEAVQQAGDTMIDYLSQAIHQIDNRLGPGYAADHPELIGYLVLAQTLDYNNTAQTAALYELVDAVRGIPEAIEEVANEIEDGLKNVGGSL